MCTAVTCRARILNRIYRDGVHSECQMKKKRKEEETGLVYVFISLQRISLVHNTVSLTLHVPQYNEG